MWNVPRLQPRDQLGKMKTLVLKWKLFEVKVNEEYEMRAACARDLRFHWAKATQIRLEHHSRHQREAGLECHRRTLACTLLYASQWWGTSLFPISGNPAPREGRLECGPQGQVLQKGWWSWRMATALQWTIETKPIWETSPYPRWDKPVSAGASSCLLLGGLIFFFTVIFLNF